MTIGLLTQALVATVAIVLRLSRGTTVRMKLARFSASA